MTTFTSEDRESVYKHNEPTHIVDSGASVDDREDSMQMLRDQLHAQQCEINALRKALMYANRKETGEVDYAEFLPIWKDYIKDSDGVMNVQLVAHYFYNLGIRKAQEK